MHFVIAGGVSVNDPKSNGSHDKFPWNFLNPAAKKAKQLANAKKAVTIFVYEYAYAQRALHQVNEHSKVAVGVLPCTAYSGWDKTKCDWGYKDPPKNSQHFIDIIRTSMKNSKVPYQPIANGKDLASKLAAATNIEGIYYFGHSSMHQMFLEYGVTTPLGATQTWGLPRAKQVPKSSFASGAKFISYGCSQGEHGGLCDKLNALWGIRCVGSIGKTNYTPIGHGKPYPSSNGGWVAYEDGWDDPVPSIDKE